MKIIKYEKKGNNKYKIYFDNNKTVDTYEDVILKNKLLYKTDIDNKTLTDIETQNDTYDIYNKCVNYIGVRLRSTKEIKDYLKRKNISSNLISDTIDKLQKNNLLNDEIFAKAFINDKFNFTTMGPYRIELELQKHQIDKQIIYKYLSTIEEDKIIEKINKQILKLIKAGHNKANLKTKIYNNLLSLGYSSDMILNNLNKYDF